MYSLENYRVLLEKAAAAGRSVRPLTAGLTGLDGTEILLRHDVDYHPETSLKIAEINASLGISGTFFFLFDSPLYNMAGDGPQLVIQELMELKQEVGWHASFRPGRTDVASLRSGWELFLRLVPAAVPLVAWHNPASDMLVRANAMLRESGELHSVYEEPFMGGGTAYLSDSNCRHSFAALRDKIVTLRHGCLQLLLHPVVWAMGGEDMSRILAKTRGAIAAGLDEEFSVNPYWKG